MKVMTVRCGHLWCELYGPIFRRHVLVKKISAGDMCGIVDQFLAQEKQLAPRIA